MIGIALGLVTANAAEWLLHKHVLHGVGRDAAYAASPFARTAQGKELLGLALLAVPVAALLPVAPFFAGTLLYSSVNDYRCHERAHLDPAWARARLPGTTTTTWGPTRTPTGASRGPGSMW